ncbi:CAP domain-containing protein [Polluticaenibacter yanchengensis]|uniref:SCP domain-containing protein n=1 Tax=Polluticaenibacter yanchengensis TaxID=3014562 RepID=A0ABT4UPD6_9BACT|nr:hypothetical protein [Chitinophagaceae bacterium LY-5]
MRLIFIIISVFFALGTGAQANLVFKSFTPVTITLLRDEAVQSFCESQPLYSKLSASDKELYYWINYSRLYPRRFFDSVAVPVIASMQEIKTNNRYYTSLKADMYKQGATSMYRLNDTLMRLATNHNKYLSKTFPNLSHDGANGVTMQNRFVKAGLTSGAENIGLGIHNTIYTLVLLYLDLDVPSLGHRKTFLNADYTSIGLFTTRVGSMNVLSVIDFSN